MDFETDVESTVNQLIKETAFTKKFQEIIHNFVPVEKIPDKSIYKIIVWLFDNYKTFSTNISYNILHWIVYLIEYELVNIDYVKKFYYIFLEFINVNRVAPVACKVLYLLTESNDVSVWLIEYVRKIDKQYEHPKHTSALLCLFKAMRPEHISWNVKATPINTAFGSAPKKLFIAFENIHNKDNQNQVVIKSRRDKIIKQIDILVPNIVYNNIGSTLYQSDVKKPLVTSTTVIETALQQTNIAIPSKAISLLSSSPGQFLLVFGDEITKKRLLFTLFYMLQKVIMEEECVRSERERLIKCLNSVSTFAQQGIPSVAQYLINHFITSTNTLDQDELQLMTWIHFTSSTDLQTDFFAPLDSLILTSEPNTVQILLLAVARIIQHIMTASVYRNVNKIEPSFGSDMDWLPYETCYELCEWANALCAKVIRVYGLIMLPVTLQLHETIIQLQECTNLGLWTVASPTLAYTTLFSCNLTYISRFCSLLMNYKKLRNKSKNIEPLSFVQVYAEDYVRHLNVTLEAEGVKYVTELSKYKKRLSYDQNSVFLHLALISCYSKFYLTGEEFSADILMTTIKNNYPIIYEFFAQFK